MKLFKEHKWTRFVVIGVAVLIIAAIAMIIVLNASGDKRKINKYLDEGNKYLTELDYESAIASFNSIIAIDPANVDAYKGLWEAYCGLAEQEIDNAAYDKAMDYYEEAIDAAEEGLKNTDDADTFNNLINETEEKIEALEEIIGEQNSEEASADSDGSTSEAEPETLIGWCQTKDGANKLLSAPADAEDGATVYYYYDDGSVAKGYVIIDEVRYEFDKETGELVGQAKNVRLEQVDLSWIDSLDYGKYTEFSPVSYNISTTKYGDDIFVFYTILIDEGWAYATYCSIDHYDIDGNLRGTSTFSKGLGWDGYIDDDGNTYEVSGGLSWQVTSCGYLLAFGPTYKYNETVGSSCDAVMHIFRISDMTETDMIAVDDSNADYYYNDSYSDNWIACHKILTDDGSAVYRMCNETSGDVLNYFIIDDSGKVQMVEGDFEEPEFDGYIVYDYNPVIDGYFVSNADETLWGYLDKDGNELQMYTDATGFSNGYALVSMDCVTYDLIDCDFNVVIKDAVSGSSAGTDHSGEGLMIVTSDGIKSYYRVVEE